MDDIVAAGPEKSMTIFWEELSKRITVDTISEPGRYLGRDHMVFDFPKGRKVFLYMKDYAASSFELYESQFSKVLKTSETPFVTESVLTAQGYDVGKTLGLCEGNR